MKVAFAAQRVAVRVHGPHVRGDDLDAPQRVVPHDAHQHPVARQVGLRGRPSGRAPTRGRRPRRPSPSPHATGSAAATIAAASNGRFDPHYRGSGGRVNQLQPTGSGFVCGSHVEHGISSANFCGAAGPVGAAAGAGEQLQRVAREGAARADALVLRPAVARAPLVPPEVDPVGVAAAVGPDAHAVADVLVLVRGVVGARLGRLPGRVGAAELAGDPEQHRPAAPVVVDPVVLEDVAVAAAGEDPGADRHLERRADLARVALLVRRVLAVGVALVVEQVRVVRVDPGCSPTSSSPAACPGWPLAKESIVMPVELWWNFESWVYDAVAGRARPADRVAVRLRVAHLDAVALAVPLRPGARVDAGVARAVRLHAVVEPVVRGEAQHAVLAAPARDARPPRGSRSSRARRCC